MDPRDYIAVLAALVAVASAAGAATAVIALRGARRQYFAELRRWADEACGALSLAVHACELHPARDPGFAAERHRLRVQLSALADRGRWFFPNLHPTEFGLEKEFAFQGVRQPALDLLVRAYRLVGGMSCTDPIPNLQLRETLVDIKRRFAAEMQGYLDPRRRRRTYHRLTEFREDPAAPPTQTPERAMAGS